MYTAGIDIGGTNTRIALIDEAYEIIQRIQFPTDVNNPQATLQKIQETVQSFSVAIAGVGLSCPGPLDLKQGIILDTPNLKGGWHGLAVSKELSARLKVPVFLENDANLACLAEAVLGQGKGYSYVQFLTISTGLGSGLVIDKKIYQGAHGFHMKSRISRYGGTVPAMVPFIPAVWKLSAAVQRLQHAQKKPVWMLSMPAMYIHLPVRKIRQRLTLWRMPRNILQIRLP